MRAWRLRPAAALRALLLAQLHRGATPQALALAVAIGAVLGMFPLFGTTTALCIAAGAALRLNHALLQLVNYAMSPLQLLALIPLWKAGAWLGAPPLELSLQALQARWFAGPLAALRDFGLIALGGIGAWALLAMPLGALIYVLARVALRSATRSRPTPA